MVRLNIDLIARGTSGYTKKKRDEEMEHYLGRLTHLYLEDKSIDDVGEDLALCRNLSVLYLYDNKIEKIPDLSQNYCVTHLYLQNNHITVMSNLNPLRKLTKLYLGGNSITVVEGLEELHALEELHVEHQTLPPGEKLLFDPRSLQAIYKSLKVLNVSGNNLDSLKEFSVISDLHQLTASENKLNEMREVADLLHQWKRLWKLDLNDNPICDKSKYRDRIIVMSNSLKALDGKEISDTARQFLKNWKASKTAHKKRREEIQHNGREDYRSAENVASGDGTRMHKITSYVMPGLPRRQFEEVLAKSSASLPSSVPYSAPPVKSYGDQQFISSPTSLTQLQKTLLEQHVPLARMERSKSHVPRMPSTIQF